MAERCELCGARWEVGASTCRDCGSRRRITVPPSESSASMSGMAIVRSVLGSGAASAASESSSDVVMVRVDSSSGVYEVAKASESASPAAGEASESSPAWAADAAGVAIARDGSASAPVAVGAEAVTGIPVAHRRLASASTPSASGVPVPRDPFASAPVSSAHAAASGVPVPRDAFASAPVSSAHAAAGVPVPHDARISAPFAAFVAAAPPSSASTLPPNVPVPSSPLPLLPSSTGTLPPAVPTPLPAGFSQPLGAPASSKALLVVGVAAAVAVAVGAASWFSRPEQAAPDAGLAPVEIHVGAQSSCEQLAALAGTWVFTTATTGARRKERLGVRGFYQLQLTVDGCSARATLAKTGRTDRTAFDDDKVPRAEATLVQGEGIEAYGWAGTFVLRNDDGQGIDTRFVFARDGERLVGSWRQLGERWTSSGLYGVVEGRRDGDPVAILPERGTQPCAVRCATPEDIAQLDTPSQAAHAACMAACK